jgi:hypothetical protein
MFTLWIIVVLLVPSALVLIVRLSRRAQERDDLAKSASTNILFPRRKTD